MATPPFLPDESKPGASDLISLYPGVEQTFRDVIEDWILIEHNTNGTHKQVTLDDISTPTIAADLVGIWHTSGVLKTRFAGGSVFDLLTSNTGMPLAGGTMTGDLVLAGAPDADLKAATKKYVDDADALKANLASPALTGNPTAPTASEGDDDTSIATTAFVTTAVAASPFGSALLHIQDRKTSGTDGGTFTQGAWRKRTCDDIQTNEISGASEASSVFTLPAGTYYIDAAAPVHKTQTHQLRLRNTSDNTTAVVGMTVPAPTGGDSGGSVAQLTGRFTISGAKNFELQHQCLTTFSTTGFGVAGSFGEVEIYAEVRIWKL